MWFSPKGNDCVKLVLNKNISITRLYTIPLLITFAYNHHLSVKLNVKETYLVTPFWFLERIWTTVNKQ